ncbi:hypothetical protein [Nonomuraea basaltis]|uniref:hypothetical protein n=1 Tax=Nonomuraea basaltis TaxID=2495887 RepID=UPI0014861E61|nr:hypothetical protein [Nonomuraea basaltis]
MGEPGALREHEWTLLRPGGRARRDARPAGPHAGRAGVCPYPYPYPWPGECG